MPTQRKPDLRNEPESYLDTLTYEILSREEELTLARAWRDDGSIRAREKLVRSHIGLVNKLAAPMARKWGVPFKEMRDVAFSGLEVALRKFDPDKGNRLATYAVWPIKNEMHKYIMHDVRSVVRVIKTQEHRTVFSNLNRAKKELGLDYRGELKPEDAIAVCPLLKVDAGIVRDVSRYLATKDFQLDTPISADEDDWVTHGDMLESLDPSAEEQVLQLDDAIQRRLIINAGLSVLDDRERPIFIGRKLCEEPLKLSFFAGEFSVSTERIRQIEKKAAEKFETAVRDFANNFAEHPCHPSDASWLKLKAAVSEPELSL